MLAALTGAGLSAAAGLNAFIPLVIVGTLARFTSLIELPPGLTWLASWPAIIVSLLLLLVELVLDKIPGVDHVNDVIQSAVRPVVGAVIFAATAAADVVESSQFWKDHEWLGYVIGAIMSFAVHLGKATSRTAINAATAGTGSPVASFTEDAVAVGLSFSAILRSVARCVRPDRDGCRGLPHRHDGAEATAAEGGGTGRGSGRSGGARAGSRAVVEALRAEQRGLARRRWYAPRDSNPEPAD